MELLQGLNDFIDVGADEESEEEEAPAKKRKTAKGKSVATSKPPKKSKVVKEPTKKAAKGKGKKRQVDEIDNEEGVASMSRAGPATVEPLTPPDVTSLPSGESAAASGTVPLPAPVLPSQPAPEHTGPAESDAPNPSFAGPSSPMSTPPATPLDVHMTSPPKASAAVPDTPLPSEPDAPAASGSRPTFPSQNPAAAKVSPAAPVKIGSQTQIAPEASTEVQRYGSQSSTGSGQR